MRLLGPVEEARRSWAAATTIVVAVGLAAAGCVRPALPDPTRSGARLRERRRARRLRGDLWHAHCPCATEFRARGDASVWWPIRAPSLQRQGKALECAGVPRLETSARVRFADGEQAELAGRGRPFRIASAAALPSGARTPAQALGELRAALARQELRRSDARADRRSQERARKRRPSSLVEGLEQPETLDVKVSGDRAEVSVPGGHIVKLKREAGVWRIEDFD